MEDELLTFISTHTVAGESHAPTLLDAFFADRGDQFVESNNREAALTILANNGYLGSDRKTCFRKLTTDGGLAMHPVLGMPIVRR